MKKHVSVSSISLIHWKIQPISLEMALDHFGLYGPLISCLYSWDLRVSGQMILFVIPRFMVTLHVAIFVSAQSSPILRTVVLVDAWVDIFSPRNCGHMVGHEIMYLEAYGPCILSVYQ